MLYTKKVKTIWSDIDMARSPIKTFSVITGQLVSFWQIVITTIEANSLGRIINNY
tara:strand:+ start:826 stop:990 length:165 start_codon:yes stop_codon:yes gene_type:complete